MTIEYTCLKTLLDKHPNNIDNIKPQYLKLLSNLTIVTELSNEIFMEKINQIYQIGIIYIGIIYSESNFTIVGTGTIIIEPKLIRGAKSVGHIEEIVVHQEFRGMGVSTQIINMLKSYAKTKDCYKILLNCDENISKVYEKCDFKQKGIEMSFYL